MKLIHIVILALFNFSLLFSLEVPFSATPVKMEANLITNLLRIDPDDRKAETLPTKIWLWYDENNMFARYECRIDSTFTIGQFAPRDGGTQGDYLYFTIITNPTSYSVYFYSATPTGALSDGTGDVNYSSFDWDSSYSYTTEYNDSLWTVVFKVPFKEMRFKAEPPYKWKVRFSRYSEHNRDYYAYPYYSEKVKKEYYDKAEDIVLTHKIKGRSDWKFKPYFVKSYDLVSKTGTFDPENVGLDISFNPDTKTKMKIAINPDFTNVPPDDASDIYNEKYPVYLYENRFFFIEDIDAFGVDSNIFYTRKIVQPQFALKFTGSQDTWTYGYLCAKDKKLEDNNDDFYQLLAVKMKEPSYTVHFASAGRMNNDYYNHYLVGDWKWEFLKEMYIGSTHLYSIKNIDAAEPEDNTDKQGLYQSAYLELNPGNWNINATYYNLQKDVALDMGYLYNTGYESYDFMTTWTSDTRERFFRSVYVSSSVGYSNKLEPDKSFSYVGTTHSLIINLLPKIFTTLLYNIGRQENDGREHDTYMGMWQAGYTKWQIFRPAFRLQTGKTIIYSLNETNNYWSPTCMLSGSVKRNLSWSGTITHYNYDYDKVNYVYTPTDTLIIKLDDSYEIANFSLYYDFSNTMSLSNGLGISTYKTGSAYSNLSFYSNFRYEFKKDWFLYLGYKTRQLQDEPSVREDWLGHFRRNSASAYLKLSLTI